MKPYLPSRSIEIDEDDFAMFCEMTEEQTEAELKRANDDFAAMLDRMSPLQEYRYWRRYVLTSIMENRRRLRDPKTNHCEIINELWSTGIKKSQHSLLKWRTYRATGTFPGSG